MTSFNHRYDVKARNASARDMELMKHYLM